MNRHSVKKRIPVLIASVLICAFVLCGFGITPDIAALKVTEPLIDLDIMVKDSPGTNGAEEVKTPEDAPSPSYAHGTDNNDNVKEIKVEVWQDRVKLNGKWCSDFENFKKDFSSVYSRSITVRLIDNYADYQLYSDIMAYFRRLEITPVREQK